MLLPRATGVILLLYSGFHMTLGLWVPQFPWLLTGVLLVIGAVAMIACRSWSRLVVYDGEEHAFVPRWEDSIRTTVAFLRRQLA